MNRYTMYKRSMFVARNYLLKTSYAIGGSVVSRTASSTTKKAGPVSWRNLGITFCIGGGFLGWMLYVKAEKQREIEKERKRSLGKAKIGGAFDLIDHDGQAKTSSDFLGKWILLYFGFTHCPDICPDELEKMAKAVDILEKESPDLAIQPLFISVDPERDSPKAVKEYLKEFDTRILGLTGTKEKVGEATKNFRVYFSSGPRDQDDDYIVDHTVIMYLIDPEGQFIDYYGQNRTAKQIAGAIQLQQLKRDKQSGGLLKSLF